MDVTSWLGFVSVALFVTFTPGPGVLMAISNSLSVGPRRAMVGSLGNATGLLAVSAATAVGLGVLLSTSSMAFLVVKLLGACYLIWLGIKQWRQGARMSMASGDAAAAEAAGLTRRALFSRGVMVALTNPKAILFFSALFPQFMNHPETALRDFVVLTLTFSSCAVLAHLFYVVLARALRRGLASPTRVRFMNRTFGACFVALGVSLIGWRGRTQ
ncbi:MAG: LysE family translocator [Rubrivivax sp.]|nr:MAG: LysE family translocator [Rubrivivax sp.]